MATGEGRSYNRGMVVVLRLLRNWVEPILRLLLQANGRGCLPADTRLVLNGVLWVLGTGVRGKVAGSAA